MSIRIIEYRPPRIAMALLAAAAVLNRVLPPETVDVYSSPWAGVLLIIGGFALMIVAWYQFRVHRVAICPTEATARLIEDGAYRLTRNPMYLGMIAMLLGIAMYAGSLPFYGAALVYFVVIDRVFCVYEEAKLASVFGDQYERYRSRVRRWI